MSYPPIVEFKRHLWHMPLRDLPAHPSVRLSFGSEVGDLEEVPLLRVSRPAPLDCPRPPEELHGWLIEGWGDPSADPRYVASLESARGRMEAFDADVRRVRAWTVWTTLRDAWIPARRLNDQALALYNRLFSLHQLLLREGEAVEFLLADGVISSRDTNPRVEHPAIVQRVELVFDPTAPGFVVDVADSPPVILSAILNAAAPAATQSTQPLIREFRENPLGPDGSTEWIAFLDRLAATLGAEGRRVDGPPEAQGRGPHVWSLPMLLVRKREEGLTGAAERALERLRAGAPIPDGLQRLVGIEQEKPVVPEAVDRDWEAVIGQPTEILFAKPANSEQALIARRLDVHGSVLVQGPPGTGKSHTIANLIGHLLSQGKRVLVTSHTTKALRVLRSHLPAKLRPLCVSVLDSDRASNDEMVAAVNELTTGLDRWGDLERIKKEAQKADTDRSALLDRVSKTCARLFDAINSEHLALEDGGAPLAPSQAARWVTENLEPHGWIPGPINTLGPPPLTLDECAELYSTNVMVSQEVQALAESPLLSIGELLLPSQLAALWEALDGARDTEAAIPSSAWRQVPDVDNEEALRSLERTLVALEESLDRAPGWARPVIEAGLHGKEASSVWEAVRADCIELASLRDSSRMLFLDRDVVWNRAGEMEAIHLWLSVRRSELEDQPPLRILERLFNKAYAKLKAGVRVNGAVPTSATDLDAVQRSAATGISSRRLHSRLQRLLGDRAPEHWAKEDTLLVSAHAIGEGIAEALRFGLEVSTQIASAIAATPLTSRSGSSRAVLTEGATPRLDALQAEIAALHRLVAAGETCIRGSMARAILNDHLATLEANASLPAQVMRAAIEERATTRYAEAYRGNAEALSARSILERRTTLLQRLQEHAPAWAEAVMTRKGAHGTGQPPGDIKPAWRWRVLTQQLEERLALDERELSSELTYLREALQEATATTIYNFAWYALKERTKLPQQQALQGWATLVKSIGKGTGKLAARKRADARKLLVRCQSAVPVWIMPLNRVYDSFGDADRPFDVVIVDEASQANVFSLVALSMANEMVVVGDDQQVSPLAVGTRVEDAQQLIDQHLGDVPNSTLYGPKHSLYDLAKTSFGGSIRLAEHFRCVPDIIAFSNELSYGGEIRPLREGNSTLLPPVVGVFVADGRKGEDKVNLAEAERVTALVGALLEQPEYAAASIGVISLIGEDQALKIETLIRSRLPAPALEARRLICGTAAQFQGDERDVMVLSMVDSPGNGPLVMMDVPMMKQRFNVAASRAKDQMWVVYSLDPGVHLKPGDLRRRLLEFVRDPGVLTRNQHKIATRAESPFEREVFQELARKGYRVEQQVEVGYYRLDGVIHGAIRRIALECDGEQFHGPDRIREDMARQAILERMGWHFIRLRGARYYCDKNKAISWLVEQLGQAGIEPIGAIPSEELTREGRGTELKERILRRASELQSSWQATEATIQSER